MFASSIDIRYDGKRIGEYIWDAIKQHYHPFEEITNAISITDIILRGDIRI
jgi:hypothetical protein